MKKSRKGIALAVTALVAVAALVGAASAMAGVWKHGGEELKEKITLPLTGGEVIEIEGGASVLLCNSSLTMTTEGGSTASITAFEVETAGCFGLAGKFEGCEVDRGDAEDAAVQRHRRQRNADRERLRRHLHAERGLLDHGSRNELPRTDADPGRTERDPALPLRSDGTGTVDGSSASITDGGAWQLSEADSGTYGIG